LLAAAAHSGLVSSKLQGALRSPTFEITRPRIFYRLHGTGGQVRLVLNGLQLIRDPIYGRLQFEPGGATPHWHEQDVSKWLGQRAYIEALDDGDAYVALERVVMSDAAPPPARPNRLVVNLLSDDSITAPAILADKYQALFARVLGDWLSGAAVPPGEAADRAAIVQWMLDEAGHDDDGWRDALAALRSQCAALDERQSSLESKLVPPRRALALADGTAENERVFIRGNHKTLGDDVPRRFLEVLGGTRYAPPAQGSGRLELARQMVSPDNPLLARVAVNRLWHHHFGVGIVPSVDDFGAMGQPPTHPELLDYLATELVDHGWSLKHVHRLIVLSSTYRMSSRPQPESDRADPQNKLWHRRAVRRLEAEAIRDALLAVSGRLDVQMEGPGVMPYLTPYMTGRGRPAESGPLDGDCRRSIYLAVRRNFLPPLFAAFDYPTPFTTIGRRGTSNVPAQALAMMNNPLVVQHARHWAEHVVAQPRRSPEDRVREMFLTALGRPPDEGECAAALSYAGGSDDVQAWADLAHAIFNLKEFIFIP
jgi:hypothetical protein